MINLHKKNQAKINMVLYSSISIILTYLLTDDGEEYLNDDGMCEDVERLLEAWALTGWVN